MADEAKRYCISGMKDDVTLTVTVFLTEEQYDFFKIQTYLTFNIGEALAFSLNRLQLDSFSIDLMQ